MEKHAEDIMGGNKEWNTSSQSPMIIASCFAKQLAIFAKQLATFAKMLTRFTKWLATSAAAASDKKFVA